MKHRLLPALFIACILGCSAEHWESKVRSSESTATVSATVLYEAFDSNEFAANQKYRDKVIIVRGFVREVTDSGDSALVVLEAGNIGSVFCSVSKKHAGLLSVIEKGSWIQFKGMCRGVVLGHTMVIGCVLQE